MELFGYLSFVGEVNTVPSQNSVNGMNDPFVTREICVSTYTIASQNGELCPYLRQVALRLTGRQADAFRLTAGCYVLVEYNSSGRVYRGQDNRVRVMGNNTVSRICQVSEADFTRLQNVLTI